MPTPAYADARLALGLGDPGGLSPLTGGVQNAVTDRWYDLIPPVYRDADSNDLTTSHGWPLYGYMDAAASALVTPTVIANRIADGDLTDPSLADDAWIPWLAQTVGVFGTGVAEQRARLANAVNDPPLGSRQYLTVLIQGFLTGTQFCEVTAQEPWGIGVRVRATEVLAIGGTSALAAAVYATGRVPSGFVLNVITDEETWTQVMAVLPTWSPGEGKTWAKVQSMGLAGTGSAYGGVSWHGVEAGHTGP